MQTRALDRRSFLVLALPLLSGCVSEPTDLAIVKSGAEGPYAQEPFPVRPVDRSKFAPQFRPVRLTMPAPAEIGSIIVDTKNRQLSFVEDERTVRRYGIAVGGTGHAWKGKASVGRKATWPAWYPTDDMHSRSPGLPQRIEPGPANPLGARALYLFQDGRDTLYRIHGTSEPWSIGTEASSGCIRMINEDIIDLYSQVAIGARVLVE